jgi:hypothetical protein
LQWNVYLLQGNGLGSRFVALDKTLRDQIWNITSKNEAFAGGLGESLGDDFFSYDNEIQTLIWEKASNKGYDKFAEALGIGIGHLLPNAKLIRPTEQDLGNGRKESDVC